MTMRRVMTEMKRMTLTSRIANLVVLVIGLWACGQSPSVQAPAPANNGSSGFVPDTKPLPSVKWLDATVPAGTVLKLSLIDSLDSGSNNKGDSFRTLLNDAILVKGTVVLPSGSNVMGEVTEVVPASTGFKGRGGMLLLEFRRINTPTGASAELKAALKGLTPTRTSAVLAGPSDPGAVAAGARGREALLQPNTPLVVVLQEPLSIKVKQ
jgi:hypothetical protein